MMNEEFSSSDCESVPEERLLFSAESGDVGMRIDKFLAEKSGESRSFITRLIESGAVSVNGREVSKNYKMGLGDKVELYLPEPEDC